MHALNSIGIGEEMSMSLYENFVKSKKMKFLPTLSILDTEKFIEFFYSIHDDCGLLIKSEIISLLKKEFPQFKISTSTTDFGVERIYLKAKK